MNQICVGHNKVFIGHASNKIKENVMGCCHLERKLPQGNETMGHFSRVQSTNEIDCICTVKFTV